MEAADRLAFSCVALAVGAFAGITKSLVGFLILAVAAGLAGRYTEYLYDGGRRRVWFFFFWTWRSIPYQRHRAGNQCRQ